MAWSRVALVAAAANWRSLIARDLKDVSITRPWFFVQLEQILCNWGELRIPCQTCSLRQTKKRPNKSSNSSSVQAGQGRPCTGGSVGTEAKRLLPLILILWATESRHTRIQRYSSMGGTWQKIADRYHCSANTTRRWAIAWLIDVGGPGLTSVPTNYHLSINNESGTLGFCLWILHGCIY